MADLDTLRPEVREAVQELDGKAYPGSRTHERWQIIRAELLRLAGECIALAAERDHAGLLQKKAEAELAAMRARIEGARSVHLARMPCQTCTDEAGYIWGYVQDVTVPESLFGKRVRLLVEDDDV